MKKLLLFSFVLFLTSYSVKAQEDKPASEVNLVYCDLIVSHVSPTNKFAVQVDYGEAYSYMGQASERAIKDDKGKEIKFNSPIHALNYMIDKGWKLVQLDIVSSDKSGFVYYHYLLSKPKIM